ncbi:MAG: hypothetical protein J3K34DRAFT_509417 [Monoraphidium minutum]|nr:MAG: hypothetical protein J3K34DRAFT_509417 [Monoraphidium minutum]
MLTEPRRRGPLRRPARMWARVLLLPPLLLLLVHAPHLASSRRVEPAGHPQPQQQAHSEQQRPEARRSLIGVSDVGWVATWISKALDSGEGVLIHPVLHTDRCLDGGGAPRGSGWTTFYALTWECNNRAWQFWQHNGAFLWTNMAWKQAWRDFCLRRAPPPPPVDPAAPGPPPPPPLGALVADCNRDPGLAQIGFSPDQDAEGTANPQLHPRTQSVMFRVVWRSPDPASREAHCLTDRRSEPAAFEPCRDGGRYELPHARDVEARPPYRTFTDPTQLWTIPRPFVGVETSG